MCTFKKTTERPASETIYELKKKKKSKHASFVQAAASCQSSSRPNDPEVRL